MNGIIKRYQKIHGTCSMISFRTLELILINMMRMVVPWELVTDLGAWPVIIDEFVVFGKKKVKCLGEEKMMED